ncbi:MAG: general secretion pathway protein GspK [Nitrospirae bacterium]|nr:general secretion pathway protein GspK [Nitrospirota bacterium]
MYNALNESWVQKLPPIPLGDGFVTVEITDEDSRINVNTAGKEVKMSLSDNLAEESADEIIAFRGKNPPDQGGRKKQRIDKRTSIYGYSKVHRCEEQLFLYHS